MGKMFSEVLDLFKKIPRIVGVEGRNHFERSWDNEGFTDTSLVKWPKRKEPVKLGKKGKKRWQDKNAGRKLLVSHLADTRGAHLKDSIQVEVKEDRVIFSTDKPYAEVHNEGGRAGRGKGFNMPKRQFIGPSKMLDGNIKKKIDREIEKLFK